MRPKQSLFIHLILFLVSCGIANIVYFIIVRNQQKHYDFDQLKNKQQIVNNIHIEK